MASIIRCKCLWKHLKKKHAMHDVDACESRLRLYCESVKNRLSNCMWNYYCVWCVMHCDTVALLIVTWLCKTCKQCSLVLIKLAIDCMYASWNLYCHCSVTCHLVYCHTVALFTATWSPQSEVNPSLYYDNRFLVSTWTPDRNFATLVALFIPRTAWEPITVSDATLLHGYAIGILPIPCSHMIKISERHQVSTNGIECILCMRQFYLFYRHGACLTGSIFTWHLVSTICMRIYLWHRDTVTPYPGHYLQLSEDMLWKRLKNRNHYKNNHSIFTSECKTLPKIYSSCIVPELMNSSGSLRLLLNPGQPQFVKTYQQ